MEDERIHFGFKTASRGVFRFMFPIEKESDRVQNEGSPVNTPVSPGEAPGSTWQGRPPLPLRPSSLSLSSPSHFPFLFGRCLLALSRNPRSPPTPGPSPFHWTFVSLSIGSFLPFEPGFVPFRGTVGSSFDGQTIWTHFHRSTSKARSKRARRAHVKQGEAKPRTQQEGKTSKKFQDARKDAEKNDAGAAKGAEQANSTCRRAVPLQAA